MDNVQKTQEAIAVETKPPCKCSACTTRNNSIDQPTSSSRPMSSKVKSLEDFEGLYLRRSMFSRAMANIPKKRINEILHDKDFLKIVQYMSRRYYHKNPLFFDHFGYTDSDLYNISIVYGLSFYQSHFVAYDKRGEMLMLCNYLSQRLSQFSKWLTRRFGALECISINMEDLPTPHHQHGKQSAFDEKYERYPLFTQPNTHVANIAKQEFITNSLDDEMDIDTVRNVLLEEIDDIETRISIVKNVDRLNNRAWITRCIIKKHMMSQADQKNIDIIVDSFIKDTKIMLSGQTAEANLRTLRSKKRKLTIRLQAVNSQIGNRSKVWGQLRAHLQANSEKYQYALANAATSVFVTHDVHKIARKYCKKHGINYISWLKKQMQHSSSEYGSSMADTLNSNSSTVSIEQAEKDTKPVYEIY